jgi:zinc protease
LLSSLQVQYADPGYLARAALDRVVYGASPYGLPGEGTPDTAKKLTRDALASFHDSYYVPSQALLAFAGDITPEAAFAAAEKYFSAWPKKELPAAQIAMPPATSGLRFVIVDKPDAVQTQIRIGRLGIARNNPDYIALLVTNRIFGGGYNSRLNTEVRINKGLTYGAYSSFEAHKHAGIFTAGTFTRTEGTVDATKLVLDLIGKMSVGNVTAAEMDFARDYLAGVYPIESETAEQVADRVLTVAEFGLPADYNDTYQRKVRAVSTGDVKVMASRYFDAKNLDVILVGNASQFRDALKKAFPDAKCEEIPFDQLDLLNADLRRPKEAAPAATPESLARGRATLEAAVQAAGGAAFGKIESLEVSASGQAYGPGGQQFSIDVKTQVLYPDRIRIELKLPFGAIQQGFDGKSTWLISPQGPMALPNYVIGEFLRGIALVGAVGLYQKTLTGGLEAQFLGEEEIAGKKTEAVQWNASFGPVKLYFDAATHQLVAARFRQFTQQGTVDAEQQWSDFRAVDGIQIPYQTLTLHDGAKFSNFTVQDVKLNTKPDPSFFSKPQPQPPK